MLIRPGHLRATCGYIWPRGLRGLDAECGAGPLAATGHLYFVSYLFALSSFTLSADVRIKNIFLNVSLRTPLLAVSHLLD